jgi:type IV pilus assembly protein PilV
MKRVHTPFSAAARHRGFSLIEMLVGVLVISFGLLGLMSLQARTLQLATTTEDSQRAALLANEITAQMLNAHNVNLDSASLAAWSARASDAAGVGMPNGAVNVTVNGNTAVIAITWRPTGNGTAANDSHRYVTTVVIPQ